MPVWIMPLSLVVQNFLPGRNRFDVVIIDEASQADVMSLVALYLGRRVVVVGDDEQVSPDAVGQTIANVQRLIDTHLPGIPNRHLYDPKTSVYDLAKTSFEGVVCLREHFRCVPDIIQFSNLLSYDGRIKPLRDASSVSRHPFTVAYRVEGANESSLVNRTEARAVASLLVACAEQPEYDGATFGVISLVGDEQAFQIESILRRRLPVSEYVARLIRCGNSAQFQGDERVVMFLSVVGAPAADGPLRLLSEETFKKRFNVAASRACDQMWVVYSLNEGTDLKQNDLRRRLIEHAKDPQALLHTIDRKSQDTESEFERLVLQRLVAKGFRVTPQWSVGAYRIDMVVEGQGRRLAIECDGDRWHQEEQIAADMARQAILERLGWRFVRIRGSQFFRTPDDAMTPVFERLAQLGIEPETERPESGATAADHELRDRVVRRAAELLKAWTEDEDDVDLAPRVSRFRRSTAGPSRDDTAGSARQPRQSSDTGRKEREKPAPIPGAPTAVPQVPLQRVPTAEPSTPADQLTSLLNQRRVDYVDKRPIGGALWILGGSELASLMSDLAKVGYRFTFSPSGGRVTKHRPGWWFAK